MTITPSDSPDKPRRRLPHWGWFLLVAVILGIVGVGLHFGVPYSRQMALLNRVSGLTIPWGPTWLREALGDDRMRGLEGIYIVGGELTDEDVAFLREFHTQTLTKLRLHNSRVTARGLAGISQFGKLTDITLSTSVVDQALIDQLDQIGTLETIILYDGDIPEPQMETWRRQLKPCKFGIHNRDEKIPVL